MLNKAKRIAIFLLYTLLIFQSYVFVLVPSAIFSGFNIFDSRFLVIVFCPCVVVPWGFAQVIFLYIPKAFLNAFPEQILGMSIALLIHCVPLAVCFMFFYWWCKKQYPLTAWGIAFMGSCYATLFFPPPFSMAGPGGSHPGFGWVSLPFVNCFYLFLCTADVLQKRLWPNNRFANRIRCILSRPCIHPTNCVDALSEIDAKNLERFRKRKEKEV